MPEDYIIEGEGEAATPDDAIIDTDISDWIT